MMALRKERSKEAEMALVMSLAAERRPQSELTRL
jgi:hypothetical protein